MLLLRYVLHCHLQRSDCVLTVDVIKRISCDINSFFTAALRAAQACRYLINSEADFEVFRHAGATRCTDGGEIWHG